MNNDITRLFDEVTIEACAGSDGRERRKIVKTRKDHECCICFRTIRAGERAAFFEGRVPRCDDLGYGARQVGIWYFREWACEDYGACVARWAARE